MPTKKSAEHEHPYESPGSLSHVRGVRAREIVRLAAEQVKDPSTRFWLLADERGTSRRLPGSTSKRLRTRQGRWECPMTR